MVISGGVGANRRGFGRGRERSTHNAKVEFDGAADPGRVEEPGLVISRA